MGRGSNNFKDLTGMQFGQLTVNRRGPTAITPKGQYKTRWWCTCSCGNPNEILVHASSLQQGSTLSCGCIQRHRTSKAKSKKNTYVFEKDYVAGYTASGDRFIIDHEDYAKIAPFCWYVNSKGYIEARDRTNKHNLMILHRLIMGVGKEMQVDHINHDTRDNRRCNLRVLNNTQNMMNRGLQSNNTSGVTGVHRNRDRWAAAIGVEGKTKPLGRFDTFEEAVAVRKAAEEKYFGEYSYDNSIAAVPRIDMEPQAPIFVSATA